MMWQSCLVIARARDLCWKIWCEENWPQFGPLHAGMHCSSGQVWAGQLNMHMRSIRLLQCWGFTLPVCPPLKSMKSESSCKIVVAEILRILANALAGMQNCSSKCSFSSQTDNISKNISISEIDDKYVRVRFLSKLSMMDISSHFACPKMLFHILGNLINTSPRPRPLAVWSHISCLYLI